MFAEINLEPVEHMIFVLRAFVLGLVGLSLMSLTACQPYEDGPVLSFKSAEKRIFGLYHLTEYTVDGVDSISLYNDSLSLVFDFYYNDVDAVNALAISGSRADGGGCNVYWHWHLSDDELQLIVDDAPGLSIGTGPFGKGRIGSWTLLRLKSKEIKMKTTYNNKEYQVLLVDDF
jgi:hypothetical protein